MTHTNRDETLQLRWTEGYEVGDTIHFKNPHTGVIEGCEIIGFSLRRGNKGLPVINKPETVDSSAHTIAIEQKYVVE